MPSTVGQGKPAFVTVTRFEVNSSFSSRPSRHVHVALAV
jgi:hypothetical protein